MENQNSIYLSLVISFHGEEAKPEDHKRIAQNVLNALMREIDNGGGLTPDEAEYITESIQITNAHTKVYAELI